MRKETMLIIGFLVIVLSTTALIWSFAIPVLRAVEIPEIAAATISDQHGGRSRTLSPAELRDLNAWLRHNRRGWVPMTSAPPSGDRAIDATPTEGAPFELRIWDDHAGSDWAKAIAVRVNPMVSYRVRYCDDIQWASLARLLSQPEAKVPSTR